MLFSEMCGVLLHNTQLQLGCVRPNNITAFPLLSGTKTRTSNIATPILSLVQRHSLCFPSAFFLSHSPTIRSVQQWHQQQPSPPCFLSFFYFFVSPSQPNRMCAAVCLRIVLSCAAFRFLRIFILRFLFSPYGFRQIEVKFNAIGLLSSY